MSLDLEKIDILRYSRQIPLLGALGQLKLLESKVAVVGLGGLGSLISMYLAAMGVGKLIIIDYDFVSVENLNRQILYSTSDTGKLKAEVAGRKLSDLNPLVEVEVRNIKVSRDTSEEALKGADIIIDGLDDWRTRLVIDEYIWEHGIPYVHAAVDTYYGQVTVIVPGKTTCLACITPKPIPEAGCRAIVAPTVGIVASIEVMEALKLITGVGKPSINKLIVVNALKPSIEEVNIRPDIDCNTCRKALLS